MERNLTTMHIVYFLVTFLPIIVSSWASPFLRGRFLVRVRVFVRVCVDAFLYECVFSCVFACFRANLRGLVRDFFLACFLFFFYKFPAQGPKTQVAGQKKKRMNIRRPALNKPASL